MDNTSKEKEQGFEKENYMETGRASESHELFPMNIVEHTISGSEVVVACENSVRLRLQALSAEILHFRFAPDGHLGDDFSYAALPEHFKNRPDFDWTEDEKALQIKTPALTVHLDRKTLLARIMDAEGHVLSEGEKGFHWEPNRTYGGNIVKYSRRIQPSERFYGLGDKSCMPDLRGERMQMWGSDTYAYGADTDPLYKNIPFFIGYHHGQAYGIFFDNTHRSFFDFGKERSEVSSFWAQGGQMNFYFIAGPRIADVVKRFAQLTGTPELPPLWALGYHQCKWSYRTEEEYRNLAHHFVKHRIPCDALYLDIDYMDGYRCFTWNREAFPDPPQMIHEIHEQGFKTVAMIDPGIKVDPGYSVYDEGIAGDHFCRQMDGDIYTGQVWPGAVHFPDYTKPSVREWWETLYQDMVQKDGVHGFWNDMNEPADFNDSKTFPRHIRHDFDGHPCSHRKAHNVYGTQMVRATRDGIARYNHGKRPFVITRSAYAGAWRYSSAWTGDNISNWQHLRLANIQCQRLNLSGYTFVGSDIGGFLEKTNGELYTRWIQLGIFHPFCRTHSSGEHGDQEPWSFGEPYTSIVRKFIELRYRLLPYIYTTFRQHVETGAPFLRSLIYLDDSDQESFHRAEEFGVGDHLLTCPVSEAGAEGRWMYLPKGTWYNFWTDECLKGGEELFCEAALDRTPLFVKAGALLPLDPVRQMSWEQNNDPQEWHLYLPDAQLGEVTSQLYQDSGDHYSYQDGDYFLANFMVKREGEKVTLTMVTEGEHQPPRARLHLHGILEDPSGMSIDGQPVTASRTVDLPAHFKELVIDL